jgi:mono/diheme cytochrome c family protein
VRRRSVSKSGAFRDTVSPMYGDSFLFARPLRVTRVLLAALSFAACDRPPAPTREWTPRDHDRADENSRVSSGAQAAAPPRGSAAPTPEEENRALTEMTWQNQCASCHGAVGRGDGPNGPMMKATNLTAEDWQSKVTNAEIAAVIKNGKAQMPKFDLPDRVVVGLVERIRASRGR